MHGPNPDAFAAPDCRSFVILDPEGYKIEFEQFNPHAENERLIRLLHALPDILAMPQSVVKMSMNVQQIHA